MKKGLWGVVKPLGEEDTIPLGGQQASQFAQNDEKALGIIITSLGDDFLHFLEDPKSATREAWESWKSCLVLSLNTLKFL